MVNLPTKQECMHLIKITYRMPQNIIDHSIQVNKVAVFIALKLKEKGFNVDVDLVDRASILHDVLKIIEINHFNGLIFSNNENIIISKKDRLLWFELKRKYGNLNHENAAYQVFKEKYPEMALIIKKHGYHNYEKENELSNWEEKIVNYADKRVMHTQIVSMKERLDEGHKRYREKNLLKGIDEEFQIKADKKLFDLEKEIFNNLDFNPNQIIEIMQEGNKDD